MVYERIAEDKLTPLLERVKREAKKLIGSEKEIAYGICENNEIVIFRFPSDRCENLGKGRTIAHIHTHPTEEPIESVDFSIHDLAFGISHEIPILCVCGGNKQKTVCKCIKSSEKELKEAKQKYDQAYLELLKKAREEGRFILPSEHEKIIYENNPYRPYLQI